jgi:hypothetical protein
MNKPLKCCKYVEKGQLMKTSSCNCYKYVEKGGRQAAEIAANTLKKGN